MKAVLVLTLCLLAAGLAGWRALTLRAPVAAAERELATLAATTAAAADGAQREHQRLAAVEADTAQLLERIATLSSERRATQRLPSEKEARERHTLARELAERGAWQEALTHFEWCYDRAFLRTPALIKNFARLAASYPPAAAALQVRLQEAEGRARQHPHDTDALQDFIALDTALNHSAGSFALYDQLPAEDERRPRIARALAEEFIARQRYTEVAAIVPDYERTNADLDARLKLIRDPARALPTAIVNEQQRIAFERARAAQLKATIDSAAVAMEVLAGTGETSRAQQIAEKVLLLDSSAETRAALSVRLRRAGVSDPLGPPAP